MSEITPGLARSNYKENFIFIWIPLGREIWNQGTVNILSLAGNEAPLNELNLALVPTWF